MFDSRKIFSQIYDDYVDKIYRFIFLKVNSQEVAEDLTSETFLRIWETFKKSNPGIKNPQAFLYQIARNLVIDHYRQKGRTPQIVTAENVIVSDPVDIEEKALLDSDLETVKLALANLSEDYQNVVIWHYLDDFSVKEIAKMTKRSEESVRVQLHRALKTIRSDLSARSD